MLALRLVVGAVGLLAVLMAARIWTDPAAVAAQLGLTPGGALGLATLRADIAGLFGATGGLALVASVRSEGRLLLGPLVFIGVAFAGRLVNLAVVGFTPDQVAPLLVEVVALGVFAVGFRGLVPGAVPAGTP